MRYIFDDIELFSLCARFGAKASSVDGRFSYLDISCILIFLF